MSRVRDVQAAIDAGEPERALGLAVAAWRAQRVPELADLVDAVAARCPRVVPPHSKSRFGRWWMERALTYEPVLAGTLAEHASERMFAEEIRWAELQARWPMGNDVVAQLATQRPWWLARNPGIPSWIDRFAAIATWPDDPRVARLLATWLVEGKILDLAPATVVRLLAERIGALGDARSLPALRAAIDEPRGASAGMQGLQLELAHLAIARIGQTRGRGAPAELLDEARTLIARLAPTHPLPASPRATDVLWHQVAEQPDDIAPRLVLADALGDARGELVVLQCAAATDAPAKAEARIHRLIKQHWSAWLGDLALVVTRKGSEFHHGMLEVVRIGQTSTPAWTWAKVRGHRELGTVHTVRANHVAPRDFVRFVLGLRRFPRTLELNAPEIVDELRAALPQLPTVELTYTQHSVTLPQRAAWPPLADTFEKLAKLAPHLERIELPPLSPYTAKPQIRDLIPTLPRLFPALKKIRVASWNLREIRDDPDALARTATLPLVELYEHA